MRWAFDGRGGTMALLALAAVALYVASRTAAAALARNGSLRPGLRAAGHWLPIAVTAVVALQLGRPEIAVTLAFSTSIASLAFVLGVLTYIAPMEDLPASRRAWPFVLPAALLTLVAGFSGELTWIHALAMAVMGGAVYAAWREATAQAQASPSAAPLLADAPAAQAPPPPREQPSWIPAVEIVLAVALAIVGGWAAVTVAGRVASTARFVSTSLMTVSVLTPLLALPMLAAVPHERAKEHTASMASTLVAVLTIVWHIKTGIAVVSTAAGGAPIDGAYSLTEAFRIDPKPLPFPLVTWRVDAVVLAVLGFAMIPVALGRWALGRWEAIGLVAGYALYLVATAAITVRT
jgi:Ca2+/Na+ antiporter